MTPAEWESVIKTASELQPRIDALEKALYDACFEKVVHGHPTTIIDTALKLKVPGVKELVG